MTESDLMALWFYVEYIDDEILIPEGEYTIDDSNDYWSVIQGDGSLGKSFYSTHDGEYFTSLYFLVGGTVKVTKKDGKLHFEMHAVNSYDVPVLIIYEAPASEIENVKVENMMGASKSIIDGRFIIIKDGVVYNAQGAVVE